MGQAHDTRRCAKRTCCRSGKGRFAACSGRNSRGFFFLSIFIHQFKLYILFTFMSRLVDSKRPDQHFFNFWKRPGGRLLPYFCSQKRPRVANAPGALFRNFFWYAPRGGYSVPYGNTTAEDNKTNCQIRKVVSKPWNDWETKPNNAIRPNMPN